ncbi:MAG: hypothetical protein H7A35_00190 [Planctomycetales bacterium]|nr:hypothetical protein [bacterium]UNM08481.1 MAG: hypothetical protein H7A35_00190 [Planctomycetales bacterium]
MKDNKYSYRTFGLSLLAIPLLMAGNLLCSYGMWLEAEVRDFLANSWEKRERGETASDSLANDQKWQLYADTLLLALELVNQDGVMRWDGCVWYEIPAEQADPRHARYPSSLPMEAGPGYASEWASLKEPHFYANPYTATSGKDFDAEVVPFGWTAQAVGNFSYLTQRNGDGETDGFMLVAWGPDQDSGHDLDGGGSPDGALFIFASERLRDSYGNSVLMWQPRSLGAMIPLLDGEREVLVRWPGQDWRPEP